ncbi:type II secretion system protein F [Lentzea sp. NBRC 105346]|uniref:type II secretion system F family protein n=1 Tax=Lentzea sp. NBRC 105346 TaxID=3032205 RepID=UPI0024A204E5|nr:type II secretion system F family protein [Lentzea sp. NBRC 105346]GLZ32966.1 type II secretion system protein F [Lentzea sp. NBRC 105346]
MTLLLLALALLVAPTRPPAISRLTRQHDPPPPPIPPDDSPFQRAADWDLLAACLRAGLPVATAVRAIEVPALDHVAELLALGADPQQAWAKALEDPETAPLAVAARRTARSGTALAQAAAELAARMRADAGDRAEARAQRAAVLVAGPLALCFLPAFVCVGVLPVVLGLAAKFLEQ